MDGTVWLQSDGRMCRRPADAIDHWLVRPGTIRLLWIVSSLILAILVALDLGVAHHPHFGIDGSRCCRRLGSVHAVLA